MSGVDLCAAGGRAWEGRQISGAGRRVQREQELGITLTGRFCVALSR